MDTSQEMPQKVQSQQVPPFELPKENFRLLDQVWFQRVVVWGGIMVRVGDLCNDRRALSGSQGFSYCICIYRIDTFSNGDFATLMGSVRQMLAGYGLAAAIGIPMGLMIGSSRVADFVLGFYVNALFVTSLIALLPLLIILFGVQFKFRVAIVFLFAIFYIIINTATGVRSVGKDLLETAASFSTPRLKVFTKIIIPASLPYIIAGLRLGLGSAVKGMIISELWVIRDTGGRLKDLGLARNLPDFFALVLLIVILGAIVQQLLDVLPEMDIAMGQRH